jgi:phytoene dehydrogenase-like protein
LVSGYSGIGKSSVVNELHKALIPPHGLFASGKFDQYKRDIPYATLVQAFQSLLRPLLSKSEAELSKWRDALRQALDPNGQLIMDLVPELRLIIGDQAPVPELPPLDARRRFHTVLRRFINVFARPEHWLQPRLNPWRLRLWTLPRLGAGFQYRSTPSRFHWHERAGRMEVPPRDLHWVQCACGSILRIGALHGTAQPRTIGIIDSLEILPVWRSL